METPTEPKNEDPLHFADFAARFLTDSIGVCVLMFWLALFIVKYAGAVSGTDDGTNLTLAILYTITPPVLLMPIVWLLIPDKRQVTRTTVTALCWMGWLFCPVVLLAMQPLVVWFIKSL